MCPCIHRPPLHLLSSPRPQSLGLRTPCAPKRLCLQRPHSPYTGRPPLQSMLHPTVGCRYALPCPAGPTLHGNGLLSFTGGSIRWKSPTIHSCSAAYATFHIACSLGGSPRIQDFKHEGAHTCRPQAQDEHPLISAAYRVGPNQAES